VCCITSEKQETTHYTDCVTLFIAESCSAFSHHSASPSPEPDYFRIVLEITLYPAETKSHVHINYTVE